MGLYCSALPHNNLKSHNITKAIFYENEFTCFSGNSGGASLETKLSPG